jgi:hypothetical protein
LAGVLAGLIALPAPATADILNQASVAYADSLGNAYSSLSNTVIVTMSNPPPLPTNPPKPQVTFGDVPINGVLTVANASAFDGYLINWAFTPQSASAAPSVIQSRASSDRTIAASGASVQPLNEGLTPGFYQVLVTITRSGNSTVLAYASGQITFTSANTSAVQVYPNPWRSDKHAAHPTITFAGLAADTTIKLFTISGHKIKEIQTDGPSVTWDLTDDTGNKAGSGIYLYLITDAAGDKIRGKLAIIK